MISLKEWREQQINELTGQDPMSVVHTTMARITPLIKMAQAQIDKSPADEDDKESARKTLDWQLKQASTNRFMGQNRGVASKMDRGQWDAATALKLRGGISSTAANALTK